MCFEIHSRYPKPRTAKKDIVCYKSVYATFDDDGEYREFYSVYQTFLYRIGTEYSLGKELKVRDGLSIDEGFHSFSNKKKLKPWNTDEFAHLKCIIPAGSTYYYDPLDREYVSDRIRIVEEIDED